MDDQSIASTTTKMNKVRFLYAERNNTIIEKIKEILKEYNVDKNIFSPVICDEFIKNLNQKKTLMQEKGVKIIETCLSQFLNFVHQDSNSSSPNSKTRRFSKDISSLLEQSFCYNMYPSEDEKLALAQRCRISLKQVSNWFTNKRNRTKTIRGRRSY